MNFELNNRIYSLPLAKPAEAGPQYSLEEYEIGGEDKAFLFLDSYDEPFHMPPGKYSPWDRQRICIAEDDIAIRLWRMALEAGAMTNQLYRAEDFEDGGFVNTKLKYARDAREVERAQALEPERASRERTQGKTLEQLDLQKSVAEGNGLTRQVPEGRIS